MSKSKNWNATWDLLPPITVDLDGNIVDPVLEANLRLVMQSASRHRRSSRRATGGIPITATSSDISGR